MSERSVSSMSTTEIQRERKDLDEQGFTASNCSRKHDLNVEYARRIPLEKHFEAIHTRPDGAPQARAYLRSLGFDV